MNSPRAGLTAEVWDGQISPTAGSSPVPALVWGTQGESAGLGTTHSPLPALYSLPFIIPALIAVISSRKREGRSLDHSRTLSMRTQPSLGVSLSHPHDVGGVGVASLPSPCATGARLARLVARLLHVPPAPGSSASGRELAREGSHVLGSPSEPKNRGEQTGRLQLLPLGNPSLPEPPSAPQSGGVESPKKGLAQGWGRELFVTWVTFCALLEPNCAHAAGASSPSFTLGWSWVWGDSEMWEQQRAAAAALAALALGEAAGHGARSIPSSVSSLCLQLGLLPQHGAVSLC